jgi:4-amino-4-deoxy-L-arabinose transferase-like glycosyltransferase
MDSRWLFVAVLVGTTLLHTILAVSLPVSGDEAYYWDCSRHLAWAYFDQPPLVIWAIAPFRAILGETRLAVRAPALIASLLIGAFMLPLVRRMGGGPREASVAYLLLHGTPLFFLGSFYCSTDSIMIAAFLAATVSAVAIAQAERSAWWGVAVAVGLGFLAKFPIVLVLPALLPAVVRGPAWRDLRRPTPYLAGALCLALTTPVWLWGAGHDWANIAFQLTGRHESRGLELQFLVEFLAGNLLLATPTLAAAVVVAWWLGKHRHDPGWMAARIAAATPLAVFAALSLLTRVSPHWSAPGMVVAFAALAMVGFRGRRVLVSLGVAFGLAVSLAAIWVVLSPERLLDAEWSYEGRPHRISTDKLAALLANNEITAAVASARRPHELVASESYSTVHLLAFLSGGTLPTRLAHVKPGKHGLASLYWYSPQSLRGIDVLFVTEKRQVDERLREIFEEVEEEKPIEIVRDGSVVRAMRLLRCRNLLHPEGVFTRLQETTAEREESEQR